MQALFFPACPAPRFFAEPKGARPLDLPLASGSQEPESLQVVRYGLPSVSDPAHDQNKNIKYNELDKVTSKHADLFDPPDRVAVVVPLLLGPAVDLGPIYAPIVQCYKSHRQSVLPLGCEYFRS